MAKRFFLRRIDVHQQTPLTAGSHDGRLVDEHARPKHVVLAQSELGPHEFARSVCEVEAAGHRRIVAYRFARERAPMLEGSFTGLGDESGCGASSTPSADDPET